MDGLERVQLVVQARTARSVLSCWAEQAVGLGRCYYVGSGSVGGMYWVHF